MKRDKREKKRRKLEEKEQLSMQKVHLSCFQMATISTCMMIKLAPDQFEMMARTRQMLVNAPTSARSSEFEWERQQQDMNEKTRSQTK